MFIKTFKTSKYELIIILIGLVCFIATLWYIISSSSSGAKTTSADPASGPEHFLTSARTSEDRISFLSQFGWKVEPDPLDVRDVVIPAEFDGKLAEYNEIQKTLGFDIEKYKGRRVRKWEYAVTNYPGSIPSVKATLLIYNGKVIGGDISGNGSERFTHGLCLPASKTDDSADNTDSGESQ